MSLAEPSRAPLPFGISSAAIFGWAGGACGWLFDEVWQVANHTGVTNGRTDQMLSLIAGAGIGALVLAGCARQRRRSIAFALTAGMILGGVASLVGTTLSLFLPISNIPREFFFLRCLTWALTAGFTAAALGAYTWPSSVRRTVESIALGALGGAIAAAIFTLPGPAEIWHALALGWLGLAIGIAAVGPTLWHAPAVVQVLPKGETPGILSLQETPINNGHSMQLGEAQLACSDDRIFLYPPAGGAVINGQPCYRPVQLFRNATLTVGRARFRILLQHSSMILIMTAFASQKLSAQSPAASQGVAFMECASAHAGDMQSSMGCLQVHFTDTDLISGWQGQLASNRLVIGVAPSPSGTTLVFPAPALSWGSLARVPLLGSVATRSATGELIQRAISWRPPFMALPGFAGRVNASLLSSTLLSQINDSDESTIPPLPIAALLLLATLIIWLLIPALIWSPAIAADESLDHDLRLQYAMENSHSMSAIRGAIPHEAPPRHRDDITAETARRTALDR